MIQPGIYEHFMGNRYRVIGTALHSETLEECVVYEALYENPTSKLWIRPLDNFLENKIIDGQTIPKFKFISKDDTAQV